MLDRNICRPADLLPLDHVHLLRYVPASLDTARARSVQNWAGRLVRVLTFTHVRGVRPGFAESETLAELPLEVFSM